MKNMAEIAASLQVQQERKTELLPRSWLPRSHVGRSAHNSQGIQKLSDFIHDYPNPKHIIKRPPIRFRNGHELCSVRPLSYLIRLSQKAHCWNKISGYPVLFEGTWLPLGLNCATLCVKLNFFILSFEYVEVLYTHTFLFPL